jgi:hypothetical protein
LSADASRTLRTSLERRSSRLYQRLGWRHGSCFGTGPSALLVRRSPQTMTHDTSQQPIRIAGAVEPRRLRRWLPVALGSSDLGLHVYAAATMALGAIGFVWGDFASPWQPGLRGVPSPFAYVAAAFQLAGGCAVMWKRSAKIGLYARRSLAHRDDPELRRSGLGTVPDRESNDSRVLVRQRDQPRPCCRGVDRSGHACGPAARRAFTRERLRTGLSAGQAAALAH